MEFRLAMIKAWVRYDRSESTEFMTIRIQKVNGTMVALCADETDAKAGDLYLDDASRHGLSTKFGLDWKQEGWLSERMADAVLLESMLGEELRDCREWQRRGKSQKRPSAYEI